MPEEKTKALKEIEQMLKNRKLNEEDVLEIAQKVLKNYRRISWATELRAKDMERELTELGSDSLYGALVYLTDFARDREREWYENRVTSLFESAMLVQMIDDAAIAVRAFPDHGEMYYEMLKLSYLSRFRYKSTEVCEQLGMARTHFYRRRREALLLFGLLFMEQSLPMAQELLNRQSEADDWADASSF